jgi:hypothetical protein
MKVHANQRQLKSGSNALGRMVLPGCAIKGGGASCPHSRRPSGYGARGVAPLAVAVLRFHPGAMDSGRSANAGTDRNGPILLNHGHKGLPVRNIRKPVTEAAAQKFGIVFTDRHHGNAWHQVLRAHIGWSCPDMIDRGLSAQNIKIALVQRRQHSWRRRLLPTKVLEFSDQIIWKISAKSAHDVVGCSHQKEPGRRASVPLIDGYEASAVVTVVESRNACQYKAQANSNVAGHSGVLPKSSEQRNALITTVRSCQLSRCSDPVSFY